MGKHTMNVRRLPGGSTPAPAKNALVEGANHMFQREVTDARIDLREQVIVARDAQTGQLVKMDIGVADVHINSTLPMYAAGYQLQDSIADRASPPVIVPHTSDSYPTWNADNAFQLVENITVGPGGQVPEVSVGLSQTTFACVQYALGTYMPTEVDANADGILKPSLAATKRVMNAMRQQRENRVISLLTTSSNWATAQYLNLSAGQQWNGGASSDPMANIDQLMEYSLAPVTGMIMNRRVYNTFSRNSQVQKYIQFKPGVAGLPDANEVNGSSALKRLPKNIYISDMKYKSSSTAYDFLWGDVVVLLHETPGVPMDQETVATSKTFRWSGVEGRVPDTITPLDDGSGITYQGWTVRQYYDQRRGARGGMMTVVTVSDIECVTSNRVGGLIASVIQ